MGERNARYNKGTPVYLYEVHPTGYELSAIFPKSPRASAVLEIPASTLLNYIKNKTRAMSNSSTQWLQEFGRAV